MPTISFSLTEKAVIDPILTLRAPLPPLVPPLESDQTASWTATVWQGIQSELVARVVAVFTSVFAAADALIHLATGMYKGICLLAGANYNKSIVYGHFRQAAWFAVLTVAGSIAGVIWPGVFKHCRYSPPSPSDSFPDAPPSVQELATAVQKGDQQSCDQLKQFWRKSSLEDKHWFVQVFNDGIESFKTVRTKLADTVYQPVQHLGNRQVKWLSAEEVDQRIHVCGQASVCNRSFFYHATSERALKSILKSEKVEVRHEQAFRGAFVSSQPETGFGRCILAFKRNIERLSPLEHGFPTDQNRYWAGFSRDIPVTDSTLAYIMLDGGTWVECRDLEAQCQQWTGRSIKVVSLKDAEAHLASIQTLDMGIPSEWPSEDGMGQQILNTLRARASVAVQIAAPRVAVASQVATRQYAPQQRVRQPMMMAMA